MRVLQGKIIGAGRVLWRGDGGVWEMYGAGEVMCGGEKGRGNVWKGYG